MEFGAALFNSLLPSLPQAPHLVALLALIKEQRGVAAQLLDARLPVLRSIQRRLEHAQRSGAVLQDLAAPEGGVKRDWMQRGGAGSC